MANPAIQQPSACPVGRLNHDFSQRLNADATRGGPTPQFSGCMHTALHIALRASGAIGPTQEVDLLGLPLPPQNLPDCAFFMLARLESWLTGEFPPGADKSAAGSGWCGDWIW